MIPPSVLGISFNRLFADNNRCEEMSKGVKCTCFVGIVVGNGRIKKNRLLMGWKSLIQTFKFTKGHAFVVVGSSKSSVKENCLVKSNQCLFVTFGIVMNFALVKPLLFGFRRGRERFHELGNIRVTISS